MLVADGARPDTLAGAMDRGELPALARLRAEGGMHTVTSVFPSVTGPAYTPFLMGRYPGPVGLPGLRWHDRAHAHTRFPHLSRSYVGSEVRKADGDLDPRAPTIFELVPNAISAMSMIGRGLEPGNRLGNSIPFGVRAAWTHFRGDLRGWLAIDRHIADRMVARIRDEQPALAFCALLCTDKLSHSVGHAHPLVLEALRIVDDAAARIRSDAERAGRWDAMHLWIVSDHGHSGVTTHDDLAELLRSWKLSVRAHPFVFFGGRDAAVMVSGNAMAHVYLRAPRPESARERAWWPALAPQWDWLANRLLERPSCDLMLLPLATDTCEVRSGSRGAAQVISAQGRYSYRPLTGDPLGIGARENLSDGDAYALTAESDYPDALAQITQLALSARAGDVILSAAREWPAGLDVVVRRCLEKAPDARFPEEMLDRERYIQKLVLALAGVSFAPMGDTGPDLGKSIALDLPKMQKL